MTRYFFSLLGPHFEAMNHLMADSLRRRFGYEYKPIYVFSGHPNKHFAQKNHILLNERAHKLERELGESVVYLQEYEDLNDEFIKSPRVKELTDQLFAQQGQIPVYSFTSSFLELSDPRWFILGPSPSIATFYDNKVQQYQLFEKLNLPRNKFRIFKDKDELLKNNHTYPSYVSASYTSGGNESEVVSSKEMLHDFLSGLRDVNRKSPFLIAEIFEHIVNMPNVNAVVTDENKTNVLVISDQIMRGTHYLGNVYPVSIGPEHIQKITEITITIGDYLSHKGYRGLFGCDFLINDKGDLVIVDLNPRRQGGYVCNALALKAIGINLTDIELGCALGESSTVDLAYEKIQYPAAWAHSKVKPYDSGLQLTQEIKQGSLPSIFEQQHGDYQATFYKKGSIFIDGYIGYAVAVRKEPTQALAAVTEMTESLIKKALKKNQSSSNIASIISSNTTSDHALH